MNSEVDQTNPEEELEKIDEFDDGEMTEIVDISEFEESDNLGDESVEINVEALIPDIESSGDEYSARKKEVRRKLEELAETSSMKDTYAIDFDNE